MRKLTPTELFELLDVWYDDDDNTLLIKHDGNLVWKVEGSMAHSCDDTLLMYSDHSNNKKIFMNTGVYDETKTMSGNIDSATLKYREEMGKYYERLADLMDSEVCIHKK